MIASSTNSGAEPVHLERKLTADTDGVFAIDLLAAAVPLSRQKLKQAMQKGAVWLRKVGGGRRRLRRAKTALRKGDELELHYDEHILACVPPEPCLIADRQAYSVWYKPPNMLSQGSKFADHCALTRWVEKHSSPHRAVYLVHRLDRGASGLMLLAHDQKTAAKLSALFSSRNIRKRYRVEVQGRFEVPLPCMIDTPLDGKTAHTSILEAKPGDEQSELLVEIKTGRKHQIRRHLAEQGWPVLGDTLYGDHKQPGPLRLQAVELGFFCPVTSAQVSYWVEPEA